MSGDGFDIEQTMTELIDHIMASGRFEAATIGEPMSPPEAKDRLYAAILFTSLTLPVLKLTGPIEVHTLTVRIFMDSLGREPEYVELNLARGVKLFLNRIVRDFTLNSTVRTVDFAGMYGTSVGARTGYLSVGGLNYRTADVTLPVIYDNDGSDDPDFAEEND